MIPDNEISFLGTRSNYCICNVDIVNSTRVIMHIQNNERIGKYLSTFINSMSIIARNCGATVIKNAGDSVLFYFPRTRTKIGVKETSESNADNSITDYNEFRNVLDCLTTMKDANEYICTRLSEAGLPSIKYRISADYGEAELARSTTSREEDLFGSTVTLCVKINSMAKSNGIVRR